MFTEIEVKEILRSVGSDDLTLGVYLGFDKEATTKISPDATRWDINAIHSLYEQHQFIPPDLEVNVEWVERDEQNGFAVGAILLSNRSGLGYTPPPNEKRYDRPGMGHSTPEAQVAIPIVIKNFELFPLDVFQHGGNFYPLTERRLGQAFQARDMFAGTDFHQRTEEGDRGLVDQLAPPYEAAYGNYSRYGGGYVQGGGSGGSGFSSYSSDGMGKQALILPGKVNTQNIIDRLMPTVQDRLSKWKNHVYRTPTALVAFARADKLNLLLRGATGKPSSGDDEADWVNKIAPKDLIRISCMTGGECRITCVSDRYYDPMHVVVPREQAIELLSDAVPNLEAQLHEGVDLLLEGDERETVSPIVLEDLEIDAKDGVADGRYIVMTRRGEVGEGSLFTKVIDYNGADTPYKLWSDGHSYSLNEKIVGEMISADVDLPDADCVRGINATFLRPMDGGYAVLIPFTIRSCRVQEDHVIIEAFDNFGNEVNFFVTPGATDMVNVTGVTNTELGDLLSGNGYIIPPDWKLVELGRRVRLWDSPDHIRDNLGWALMNELIPHGREVLDSANAPTIESCIASIRSDGAGRFQLKGSILDSVTGTQREEDLGRTEATFLLSCLGLSVDDAGRMLDRAKSRGVIRVGNLRRPRLMYREKTAQHTELAERWNRDLFLEAAGVCDAMVKLGNPKVRDRVERAFGKNAYPDLEAAEDSVDGVLGMSLINESNIMELLDAVPKLQEAESTLAELLMYTRVGFEAVNDESVARAMHSFNEVLEELEVAWALSRGQGIGY